SVNQMEIRGQTRNLIIQFLASFRCRSPEFQSTGLGSRLRFAVQRPDDSEASPRSHGMPPPDVSCRVHVGIAGEVTGAACKDGLTLARLGIHLPAFRTSLRSVSGIYPFDSARSLLLQASFEHAPSAGQDFTIKRGLRCDVSTGGNDSSLGRTGHILN